MSWRLRKLSPARAQLAEPRGPMYGIAFEPHVAMRVSALLLVVLLSACAEEKDSCDNLISAMADRREECGAPRGEDDWPRPCDYQYVMEETCRLSCWNSATCETIRGEDQAGAMRLRDCIDGCGP